MAFAASWKGAPFMLELLSPDHAFQWDKEQVEAAKLTRRVASGAAVSAGLLAVLGMILSRRWVVMAESSDEALGSGTTMGPMGSVVELVSVNGSGRRSEYLEWTFTSCDATRKAGETLLTWLQYYGLCLEDSATHSAAILAVYRGWIGAVGSLVGGFLGLVERLGLRFAVVALFSGCFGLLSSLICFLNWRYANELLFEQAFVFGVRKEDHQVLLVSRGPVKMSYGIGLYLVMLAFCIDTFALISLLVVNKRNILNPPTAGLNSTKGQV